jgi:AraC-like DNA-binding protein
MRHWGISFQIYRSLPSFPYPGRMEVETQSSPSYNCQGRSRSAPGRLFVYTLKGRGIFQNGTEEHNLTRENAFLCRSNDPEIGWRYPDDGILPWTFLWINLLGTTAEKMCDDLIGRYGHIYQIPLESTIIKKLLSFERYSRAVYPLNPHDGAEIAFQLMITLAALFETEQLENRNSILIRHSQELMLEKLEQNVSVSEIANSLQMSREHFTRIFKAETGATPADYLLRQKIIRATHYLKESTLSSKEIATRLGYANSANFSRAFRKTLHISLKEFRTSGAIPML